MAVTTISDLFTPDIWIPGVAEKVTKLPSIINSGLVIRDPQIDQAASGGGITAQLPFFKEPNPSRQIQQENVAPTINSVTSAKQIAVMCNSVSPIGVTALSAGISGTDPLGFALSVIAGIRLRQRQDMLLSTLRGTFDNAAAPAGGTGALKSLRNDIFLEAGNSATSANLFSGGAFIDTVSVLGEVASDLEKGIVLCHSTIYAAMRKQNLITVLLNSDNKPIEYYQGYRIFQSDLLTRAGGTNGKVYDTYIAQMGSVLMGDKPQSSEVGDVAHLVLDNSDVAKNNVAVYDRTRSILHVQGTKWVGTPALSSPSDAELSTAANWQLAFGDIKNVKIACLRTNG